MDDLDRIKQQVLQQLNRCVVCHREYEGDDISSVQRKPGVWTLMVECEQCHSRNYIAAVTDGVSTEEAMLEIHQLTREAIADVTDKIMQSHRPRRRQQEPRESDSVQDQGPVTAADVLDMHDFLQDFDGDFRGLFRAKDE